jgi:hypothetical protein
LVFLKVFQRRSEVVADAGLQYNGEAMVQLFFRQLAFCKRSLKKPDREFFASVSDTETTSHG